MANVKVARGSARHKVLMAFNHDKFKNLVLYVAWKAGRRDWFGAPKLNKVLWFAEARSFVLHGSPIARATYIRQKHGPVPQQMMPIRKELERAGKIKVFTEGSLIRITTDKKPDLSQLSKAELQIIDYWIEHVDKEHTAASISDESHDYPWDIAKVNEEIPFYAILANRIRKPSDGELEKLRAVARAQGLL